MGEVQRTISRLRRAYAEYAKLELPHLQSIASLASPSDEPTLRLIASLVREIAPRHIVEFGCGPTTELLALLGFDHGRMAMTTFEHDPWAARELLRVANPFATNYRWFTFCLCPLVERRVRGAPIPVYDDGMAVPALPCPADLLLIQGPPSALGGRAGVLCQALAYARPGALMLLLHLRPDEAAMVEAWADAFAEHARFVPPGLLDRHLAFVVQEPLRAPFVLGAPGAREPAVTEPNPAAATGCRPRRFGVSAAPASDGTFA